MGSKRAASQMGNSKQGGGVEHVWLHGLDACFSVLASVYLWQQNHYIRASTYFDHAYLALASHHEGHSLPLYRTAIKV